MRYMFYIELSSLELYFMSKQELEVINNEGFSRDSFNTNSKIEVIENSNILKEGMFAILKKPHKQLYYDTGIALLIQELKFANNNLHTVIVRHHPNYSSNHFGMLLDEFYDYFDVISQADGEAIRKTEIDGIHKLIAQKEEQVQEYKTNPQTLQALAFSIYSKRIESPTASQHVSTNNIANLLGQSNAIEQINAIKSQTNMFSDIAKIQADIIKECVEELQQLMKKLTPFMVERYATALATTSEAQNTVKEINDGMATLSMYTGEGVAVYEIKRGTDAAPEIPLSLVQERILADVELAYFNDESAAYLSVENVQERFFAVLADNPKLVDQIFPTERCICIAAIRESEVKLHSDTSIEWRVMLDRLNKQSFLLIRNGENISAVYSPINTHLVAKNLFPSKDVLDQCFLSGNGEIEITIDSLNYSDALSDVERITLHYKRFLILIAGLQHRLNLLGRFYPENESFNIFFPEFQNKYFNFIHDQDGAGLLPELAELSLTGYIWQQNQKLTKGSNIICRTHNMVSEEAAPYCWTYSWRRGTYAESTALTRPPVNDYEIVTVEQDKDGYFVKFPVSSGYNKPSKMAKVRIVERFSEIDYLVLDGLSIERLDNYITKRKYRKSYLEYMGLFKGAKAYISAFESENHKNIQFYIDAVHQIKDLNAPETMVKEIVMRTINFFGPKVTQAQILNQLFLQLSASEQDKQKTLLSGLKFIKDDRFLTDCKAIAVSMDKSGNNYLYVTLPQEMVITDLDKIEKDYWVYRCPAKVIKNGKFNLDKAEIVSILDYIREEQINLAVDSDLYEYYQKNGATKRQNGAEGGKGTVSYDKLFYSYENKVNFLESLSFSKQFIEALFSNTVTREQVSKLQERIKAKRELSVTEKFNRWRDSVEKELALCLPYLVGNRYKVGAICLKDGIAWLDRLAEQYAQTDATLIEQDNHSQTIGVIKLSLHANEPDMLFTKVLDTDNRLTDSFHRLNCLNSKYVHSLKLLSYVLHSSAKKLLKDDWYMDAKTIDVKESTNYCVFGTDCLVELDTSLDAQIKNPHLAEVVPVIRSYSFEEDISMGPKRVSFKKHLYMGDEHYLKAFINELEQKLQASFDQLEGNYHGQLRAANYGSAYICSTGDFDQFKKDLAGSTEQEFVQVSPHILGRVVG